MQRILRVLSLPCGTIALLALAGCRAVTPDSARIYYRTNAPFCGYLIVEKVIDGALVARDTMFSDSLSAAYPVTPGTHVIGARAVSFRNAIPFPDTTVTLEAGASFTDVLPFYCS